LRTFEAKVGTDRFPIFIGNDIFQELIYFIKTYKKEDIFIISDNYFKYANDFYIKELSFIYDYNHLFLEGGIESKTLPNFQSILKMLSDKNIARDGLIVSIGGGVIGDLSAFIASTYQRGIDLVHVPTTTTAMIDSSIGGKTGLNVFEQVNLIGSYYNPKAIFMDLRFLSSLTNRDFYSGICESLKMAITSDKEMFNKYLNIDKLVKSRDEETLEEIIFWSVITKLKHVSGDFKEKSVRLILNYGHTFGQAIETYYGLHQDKLKHGEAVALGITAAAKLSDLLFDNFDSQELWEKTNKILNAYHLPNTFRKLKLDDVPSISELNKNIINDKKRISKGNRFILCESIGNTIIKILNNDDLIISSYKCLYQ
tara:strand:+ start:1089 stop:2195 length:1107 start_codon:yes stop_codon:yes gene_type:complete